LESFTWKADKAQLGNLTVNADGQHHSYMRLLDRTLHPAAPPFPKRAFGPIHLLKGIGDDTDERSIGYLVPDEAAFLLAIDVTFVADKPGD
jgi:hypothetical protein